MRTLRLSMFYLFVFRSSFRRFLSPSHAHTRFATTRANHYAVLSKVVILLLGALNDTCNDMRMFDEQRNKWNKIQSSIP